MHVRSFKIIDYLEFQKIIVGKKGKKGSTRNALCYAKTELNFPSQ